MFAQPGPFHLQGSSELAGGAGGDRSAAGAMDTLAGAAAVAPGEVPMPTWSSIAQQRDLQAATYIKRVRDREMRADDAAHAPRDADATLSGSAPPDAAAAAAEARRTRLLALLAKAFPVSAGMPDPAGWQVAFKPRRSGNTFSHPGFCGGIKLYSLPQVAKRAATVMAEAQEKARAHAAAGPAVLASGSGGVDRAAGALARAEQLLARNGVLAEFATEQRCATTVDDAGGEGAAAASPAGAKDAGEQAEEDEEEDMTPLQAAVKRVREELAEDVCSTVLVGLTSSGKSALLNTVLLLTEVDEHTYRSREHQKDMPRFFLGGKECKLEALGIIRDLLMTEAGLLPDEIDAKLAECVHVKLPHLEPDAAARAAQVAAQRAHAGDVIYGRVEQYLEEDRRSSKPVPDFLFPVGSKRHVTTRLATAARYGCQYHVFGHTYLKAELLDALLATVKRERAILQAHVASRRQPVLDEEQKAERKEAFFMWNACVAEQLALGDRSLRESNFNRHAKFETLANLPLLFTRPEEPTVDDVTLHADVEPLLGRFEVFTGIGDLHLDRELVRKQLAAMQEPTNRGTFVYKKAYVFGPFNVLKGGKELVDAPGTGDDTPLHIRHLEDACDAANHIVLVAPKNLSAPAGTLERMQRCGALRRFLEGKVELTVLHNFEKESRVSLANFRGDGDEERITDEEQAAQISFDAIVSALTHPEEGDAKDMSVDEVEELVRRKVRFVTPYTMSYACLKFNAQLAALPDAAELLTRTGGAALLGLLDGLNVERVVGGIDAFARGPFAAACADVDARLLALADPCSMEGSEALYKRAKKLMEGGAHTYTGKQRAMIRGTLGQQFGAAGGAGTPAALLQQHLVDAFEAFQDDIEVHFSAQGDMLQRTHASWAAARDRKFKVAADAQLARRQAVQDKCMRAVEAGRGDGAGPHGMDLRNVLLTHIALPAGVVERLRDDVDTALDTCAEACAELVLTQLRNLAQGEAEVTLVGRLLHDFASTAGSDILKERLANVLAKLSERTLRVLVRNAKQKALRTECKNVTAATLHATATDPSGVAAYLDARLDTLLNAVHTTLVADVQQLLRGVQQDADKALRALEQSKPRAQVNGPTMPGMESYLMSGLGYIVQRLHPEHRAMTVDLLASAKARGAEVQLRVQQLLASLRAVQNDVEVLGRDAERLLDMHVLYRRLWRDFPDGGTLATRGQLNSDVPLPPDGFEHYWQASFPNGVSADRTHLQEVYAALAALPTPLQLRDTRGETDAARAVPGDSLWRALAHQLFSSRNANENSPRLLKAVVLAKMLSHYASEAKNAEFTARPAGFGGGGLRVQDYVQAQHDGRLGAGMLELQMACMAYGVQVLVWRSCDPAAPPLLVGGHPQQQLRAYNIVLEHVEPAAGDGAQRLHTFRGTQRRKQKKAVSMSEDMEQVKVFSDPADKAAHREHCAAVMANSDKAYRERDAEEAAERAAKRPRGAGSKDDGDSVTSARAKDAQNNSALNKRLQKVLGGSKDTDA